MMDKELLFSVTKKQLTVQTFRGRGPGGQKRNKTDSCVRIIHKESGAVGQCCEQKHQAQNKKIAFERLAKTKKFVNWQKLKAAMAIKGIHDLKQEVDTMMKKQNLRIETRDSEGNWCPLATPKQ